MRLHFEATDHRGVLRFMPDRAAKEELSPKEIEVTPEMIEAGLLHLARYHRESGETAEDTVIEIFRAMLRASLHGREQRSRDISPASEN